MALDDIPDRITKISGTIGVCRISAPLPVRKTIEISTSAPVHNRMVLMERESMREDRYLTKILLPAQAREAVRAIITPSISPIIAWGRQQGQ
jgi:hypothetical protein